MNKKFLRNLAVSTALMSGVCAGAHAAAVGLHMGSDGSITQYNNFSNWLGKRVMYRLVFVNGSSWSDIANPYFLGSATKAWLKSNPGRVEVISLPMLPNSGNQGQLAGIAKGYYDAHYKQLAENIASKTGAPQRVIIRLGWEFNGKWYPWSAVGAASQYKAAYRHIVQVMRSKCNVLRFEWTVNWGTNPNNFDWTTAYPGDDVVDIIGTDLYDQYNKGWNDILNRYEGLAFFRNFARKHGKSEAYSEWGVSIKPSPIGHGDDTAYIQNMYNWIQAGGSKVLYANYWNTNSGGPNGVIFSASGSPRVTVPKSAALYKKLFSR
ncbi:MAG: glycoside hydrolase family 26 protein [Trinickia sp.]